MKIIWSLPSQPELASLTGDERRRLVQEALDSKALRRSILPALLLMSLCSMTGALIGDAFSSGITGSGIGGAVGGFVYTQVRFRAILKWIMARNAPSASAHDLIH